MTAFKRYPLAVFFTLAYVFPWLIWGTTIAQQRGWLGFHIPQPLAFWVGLTLATYLAALLTGGMPAVKDLLVRMLRWRVSPVWYAAALGFTALLSLAAVSIHLALGGAHQVGVLLPLGSVLPSLLFQIFFFLITEETAWRGFALPRLQARYSALTASLILGVLWGLWHLPLAWIDGSFQSRVPFGGFVLSAIAMSISTSWIFNHSRGSVLVAAIFHAATDTTIAYANVMTGDLRLFWLFIAAQWLAIFAIVLKEGAAHLARKSASTETTFAPASVPAQRPF